MKEYKKESFEVSCNCGCSKVEVSQYFEDGKAQEVYFSQYVSVYNGKYLHVWNNILEKFKMIWYIICGKNYYFFDVVLMKKEEIKKFKEAVAKLDENILM
jgi:hypothetical protein